MQSNYMIGIAYRAFSKLMTDKTLTANKNVLN